MSNDCTGEISGIGEVMGESRYKVFVPGFRGECDEGKVAGDAEIFLCHPGNQGERVTRSSGNNRSRAVGQPKRAAHSAGDLLGGAFFNHGDDGVGIFRGRKCFEQAALGCLESGEIGVGHQKPNAAVSVSFEQSAGVKGGRFPVFIDGRDLNIGLRISSDESRDALLVEPLLHRAGTLVENPGVGFGILNQAV